MTPTLHLLALPLLLASLAAPASSQQELDKLLPVGAAAGDRAGFSVALHGSRAVLGAPFSDDVEPNGGAVHVFKSGVGGWSHAGELHPTDAAGSDLFGHSVAVYGLDVVAGAPYAKVSGAVNAGRVYIFTEGIGGYVQKKVSAADPSVNAAFGWSVAYDGHRLVVGAPFAASKGAVYVFELGFGWVQTAKLIGADTSLHDQFGYSVALDGDRIVVGAPFADNGTALSAGAAYVFDYFGGWNQTNKLKSPTGSATEYFGTDVSTWGGHVLVGAPGAESGRGAADAFAPAIFGTLVHEARLSGHDAQPVDNMGTSVALDGGRALIGAPGYDAPGFSLGVAYVFTREATGWVERCVLDSVETTDHFGTSVALEGTIAIVCDDLYDEVAGNGGAAFVFDVDAVQGYGCTALNPAGSLVELSGVPAIGATWTLGVHNPLGTQAPGSFAFVAVAGLPFAGFPCGAPVPGLGMGGAGASGELLLATTPQPVNVGPAVWDGASPAPIALPFPNDAAFVGVTIYAQGALLGTAGSAVGVGLTEARSACIGVPVH